MNALQSNLARSLQTRGVAVPPNTDNLTRIQQDVLIRMVGADGPVRGGYGSEDISGTTGNSLVGRGLAYEATRPAGAKRGTYYALTDAGSAHAWTIDRQRAQGAW